MDVNQAVFFDGIVTGINNFILFGLVVLFRRGVHHEGLHSFLLHTDRRGWRLFVEGMAIGILSFLLFTLSTIVTGQGSVTIDRDTIPRTVGLLVTGCFGFLGVALFEEGLFRGYILVKLLSRFSQPVAILLAAIPFGILHLISYPSSEFLWLGLWNASLFGVLFSVTMIASDSLMWAVGFHLTWNLVESILLINQYSSVNTLFNFQIKEGFLAGTYTSPSGILVTAILIVLGFYIFVRFYGRGTRGKSITSEG